MVAFKAIVAAALLLASSVTSSPVAAPAAATVKKVATTSTKKTTTTPATVKKTSAASSYWVANIKRQGLANYAPSGYTVYRNVVDFGADPTGAKDSTAAINNAISSGSRCGNGCDSTTTLPAFVYFPPGTYLVSTPIIQYYYTQLVGDALNPPTIKAAAGFTGMAVIDADPYTNTGANWYTNQNNFYRQIRNFVIDLTAMPQTAGAGIHWQIAQATSLQNIVFNMIKGSGSKQIGIFMDNGSGGFVSDLTFNGGQYGAFFGSQQFTSRNMTFNNVQTAIFMNWNWGWTVSGITVNNCGIALDMSNAPTNQTVGSVTLMDSTINNTPIGVKTAFTLNPASVPNGGGTLVLDNVNFASCPKAVTDVNGNQVLAGNTVVKSWGQGNYYKSYTGTRVQAALSAPVKAASLLDSNGRYFTRSKPQYEGIAASNFISIRTFGATGNGATDDTAAFKKAMSSITTSQILYIDYGAYVISDTITLPANIKIVGEHWPMILATGSKFSNQAKPTPFWQVGTAGQSGAVEIQDLVFGTQGPVPGAILMEWNLKSAQGASGMWDVHFRIGGFTGSKMQSSTCAKNPGTTHGANSACIGSFLLFHATSSASGIYLENNWLWVADHELDQSDHNQVDIYNGRGLLIESQGASWFWGGAVEHSTLYNYQLNNAQNVFMGFIQSETAYFQGNPAATTPFAPNSTWTDPNFSICPSGQGSCVKTWGLRIQGSKNVYIYGTGLYSFFENYDQTCVYPNNCQQHMISVQSGSSAVWIYAMSTKASVNMLDYNGKAAVLDKDNRSNFCATILGWTM
ncbi:glycoside hydrolase family 55 protein [Myriangium duriaei CBS 260.36]|uniref:Glycoside hydrolase family 55 protein n=1 Tax=Myriangium duriaei CBS 260.36 TaxID=1168546 RepID=A0A9P4IXM7_9PEZI|nr:glycoside hydrolase family 55 protein [Myriangium duriaei CBS 260.36]